MSIHEQKIEIPTDDGHVICGIVNTPDTHTDKVIIFVHGFTGTPNQHMFFNAVPYFIEHGYAVFRFSLYSAIYKHEHIRRFADGTPQMYGKDVATVATYLKEKYLHLYIVGHSFGCPSILFSKHDIFQSIVFLNPTWDGSFLECDEEYVNYIPSLDAYVVHEETDILVSRTLYDSITTMGEIGKEVAKVQVPIKFILSERDEFLKKRMQYMEYANEPKELFILKNAGHNVDNHVAEQEFFKEAEKWFNQYN